MVQLFVTFGILSLTSLVALAQGRYTEIFLSFDENKRYSYRENKKSNSVIIDFEMTSVEEFSGIENYNGDVIRRLLVRARERGVGSLEIYLKDENLRVFISEMKDPFRVTVAIFDRNYSTEVDPVTELPLPSLKGSINQESKVDVRMVASDVSLPSNDDNVNTTKKSYRLMREIPKMPSMQRLAFDELNKEPAGRQALWREFPVFIYPLPLTAYFREYDKSRKDMIGENIDPDMKATADYALAQFRLGNEKRSEKAYQVILKNRPSFFENFPEHQWALAESLLGSGNYLLANDYYNSIEQDFPESSFAPFARIRKADLMHLSGNRTDADLAKLLSEIKGQGDHEARALEVIRRVYWQGGATLDDSYPPAISKSQKREIEELLQKIISSRSRHILMSLVLADGLSEESELAPSLGNKLREYFSKYGADSGNLYFDRILSRSQEKISASLTDMYSRKDYIGVVGIYESLGGKVAGRDLLSGKEFLLAESFRLSSRNEEALRYYTKAARGDLAPEQSFLASYRIANISDQMLAMSNMMPLTKNQKRALRRSRRDSDVSSWKKWSSLSLSVKKRLLMENSDDIITSANEAENLTIAPRIILEVNQNRETISAELSPAESGESAKQINENLYALPTLLTVADRFDRFSLKREKDEVVKLIHQADPTRFSSDEDLLNRWSERLLKSADDFRERNKFSEAAEIFAKVARNKPNWEKRAEYLYKSGLLFFRAGKKSDALATLTEASEDGNNMYYANLAKQRLSQIQ